MSAAACTSVFLLVAAVALATPFKEYFLGSYVTKSFGEVRDDVVARQLNNLGVVTSGVHYLDTFDRPLIPLYDLNTKTRMLRTDAAQLSVSNFLVRANVRRADLLSHLPPDLLERQINLMEDAYAPLCGPVSSPPQQLFGNWFPTIRHDFCSDFGALFPHDRFFDDDAPVVANLSTLGNVTLGLVAVVNMSEVYLRHFDDPQVIRKIMKSVLEGFLTRDIPSYTDQVANAIVTTYSKGITLAQVIALLPGSFDTNHIALVDILGIQSLLQFYIEPQQLSMATNVNGEAAILAEVTHATSSYFTTDFLINTVGMHLVSTVHLGPFWYCAIAHTAMEKNITVEAVNGVAVHECGRDRASVLPTFIVNLMFLFQKTTRDYGKLDNTTTYTLGLHRTSTQDSEPLVVPEKLIESPVLSIDGRAWNKERVQLASMPSLTPYGYLFTPDCRGDMEQTKQSGGRNVQKYQAFLGDGLGNCVFRDSQETPRQTLCRLFMSSKELIFQSVDGAEIALPSCSSLVTTGASASAEVQAIQQSNLRQIEWFLIDTTSVNRRLRIQDNTSRQIRTFLLILNLVGATYYVLEYLRILKSLWVFVRNSFYSPSTHFGSMKRAESTADGGRTSISRMLELPIYDLGLSFQQLLYCNPNIGAVQHPTTMALLYLGAIGALSNVFSLVCSATLTATKGPSTVVIVCQPAIPLSSYWLLLTTLSSSYWICQVALQAKTLAQRLDHAADEKWIRNKVLMVVWTTGFHFLCKSGMSYLFENAELRSDPHLYAVFGGLVMSWLVVAMYSAINFKRWPRCFAKRAAAKWSCVLCPGWFKYLPTFGDLDTTERKFLVKWTAVETDVAYHQCASHVIAHELRTFSERQSVARRTTATSRAVAIPTGVATECVPADNEDGRYWVGVHEFIMVHLAVSAAQHLENVVWQKSPDLESAAFMSTRGSSQVRKSRELRSELSDQQRSSRRRVYAANPTHT